MPNWVQNRIKFNNSDDLLKVVNRYCVSRIYDDNGNLIKGSKPFNFKTLDEIDEFGSLSFDFNRVKQMPEILSIPSSSVNTWCLAVVEDFDKAGVKVYFDDLTYTSVSLYLKRVYGDDGVAWDEKFSHIIHCSYKRDIERYVNIDEAAKAMPVTTAIIKGTDYAKFSEYTKDYKGKSFMTLSENERCRIFVFVIELGYMLKALLEKYEVTDWYGWCCKHWGTKWNSHETYIGTGDLAIWFETAWCLPYGVYEALAEQNPDVEFCVNWSDEDFGNNVGQGNAVNGEFTYDYFDDCEKEALEMAAELWGYDLAEEGYIWNEADKCYNYRDPDGGSDEESNE